MKNTVMRIVAALLVAPLIADYLYFTINIFRDQPKYMMVHMEVFYILDILALIAVVVGVLISNRLAQYCEFYLQKLDQILTVNIGENSLGF